MFMVRIRIFLMMEVLLAVDINVASRMDIGGIVLWIDGRAVRYGLQEIAQVR